MTAKILELKVFDFYENFYNGNYTFHRNVCIPKILVPTIIKINFACLHYRVIYNHNIFLLFIYTSI